MTPHFTSEIETRLPVEVAFNLFCETLQRLRLRAKKIDALNGFIHARRGMSLLSFGEDIFIRFHQRSESTLVQVQSVRIERTASVDWGINQKNVESILCEFRDLEQKRAYDPHQGAKRKKSAASQSEKSPWEILGVRRNASLDEIGRAYRALARQYHPDRMQGLAPELITIAEERLKEINRAYETLRRGR